MRYFLANKEPSKTEVSSVKATVLKGEVVGQVGKYFVVYDDSVYPNKPSFLSTATELNVPGEPARCWNCGEVYK